MNRKLRPSVRRPLWARLLLFLPDRVLDLLDVVTFDVHFGLGAFADVHATRAIQASAGARTTGGLGLHDHRSLGMKSQAEAGVSAILLGAQSYSGGLVGTSGALGAAGSSVGLHEPTDPLYQSFRDYWGVGVCPRGWKLAIDCRTCARLPAPKPTRSCESRQSLRSRGCWCP